MVFLDLYTDHLIVWYMTFFYIIISEFSNTPPSKNFNIMQMLNVPHKIKTVLHHPSVIKSLIYRKRLSEIRSDRDKIMTFMKQ